jgi:signal transduction histidine kinase
MRTVPPYAECMSSDLRSRITSTIVAGVTQPTAPRSPRLRRGRLDLVFAADVLAAIVCFGITDGVLVTNNSRHHLGLSPGVLFLLAVVVCAPLAVRTFYPLAAWSASALAMFLASLFVESHHFSGGVFFPAGVLVYILCLYAVALRCQAWMVITAGLITVVGAALVDQNALPSAIVIAAVPVFVGVIVRSRRGNREQLAVVERRHEGERALLQERQRIARELHDVVAHHMSVIAIQAEAGPYKAANPPPELVESFAEIRASALSGLNELRRVLGVLRSDQPDTAPQPGLEDMPSLLESARAGGVTVTSAVTGTPRRLPDGVDLSAYRIVQEGLSNAMRHAPGSTVQVSLFYGVAALIIEIRNDHCHSGIEAGTAGGQGAAGQPAPEQERWAGLGSGHGIIGMRERATMLGGRLDAGPTPAGEFLVTAALPLGERDEEEGEERGEGMT